MTRAGVRQVPIRQVDAFTTVPFAGNPAGVVLDPEGLSESEMRLIAREMNVAETAFLLPPTLSSADLRIRWFTPSVEVELCGHATVATFHAALEEGRLQPGSYRMECLAGVLPIGLQRDPEGRPLVRLGLPVPEVSDLSLATCRIAEPLGLETGDISDRLPAMRAGDWALVPVSGLATLHRMRPEFNALRDLLAEAGLGNAIALTTETVEKGSAVHLRMFAPGFGIDEDPVTGSAQGPVAAYLLSNHLVAPVEPGASGAARLRYTAEQGDVLGRPGRIQVEVTTEGKRVTSITIIGTAVTVLTGRITLPRAK